MDVDSYASLYSGHTKIFRLLFIADHCQAPQLELEALRMALDEIKKGDNTSLFKEVVEKIGGRLGHSYALDNEWIETVDRRASQRHEKLENELNGYKVSALLADHQLGVRRCLEVVRRAFALVRGPGTPRPAAGRDR